MHLALAALMLIATQLIWCTLDKCNAERAVTLTLTSSQGLDILPHIFVFEEIPRPHEHTFKKTDFPHTDILKNEPRHTFEILLFKYYS